MRKIQIELPSLVSLEKEYEEIVSLLCLLSNKIFEYQPKTSGSIELYPSRCGNENCDYCPHFRWKIWKGNNGNWSAYNIKEPLRCTRRKDFPHHAKECIRLAEKLLKIRAELVQAISGIKARERGYKRRKTRALSEHLALVEKIVEEDN